MEDEIKVGEYVRSLVNGRISKILEVSDLLEEPNVKYYKTGKFTGFCSTESYNVKHSSNIIDIVEPEDYVNRQKVTKVFIDPFTKKKRLELEGTRINWQGDMSCIYCESEEINEIITKEMLESISYKVKTD